MGRGGTLVDRLSSSSIRASVLALMLTLAACGDGRAKGQDPASVERTGWPASAPAYAAAYPGATVTTTFDGASTEGSGTMVSFSTADSPEQVINWYRAQAELAHLPETSLVNGGGARTFMAGDADRGHAVMVQATAKGAGAEVVVTFGQDARKAKGDTGEP